MNYLQYINESPDNITLPDGTNIGWDDSENNVPFFKVDNYFVFAKLMGHYDVKVVVMQNKQIVYKITYGDANYVNHSGMAQSLIYSNFEKAIVNTLKDFNEFIEFRNLLENYLILDSGRIFADNKIVATRQNNSNFAMEIKEMFNLVADEFNLFKIDNTWNFELISNKGKEYMTSYGDVNKIIKKPSIIISKYENPYPSKIMDRDWKNAIKILGNGFLHNIKQARKNMDENEFELFIDNQIPKIKQASLQIGENNTLRRIHETR